MAKFVYNLQNILSIKEKLEEQKKMELGNANIKLISLKDELSVVVKHKAQYENEFQKVRRQKVKAKVLVEMNQSIRFFVDKSNEYSVLIEKAEREVKKKREELREALLEKKKYEVLKERAYESYLVEEKQEESKTVDEIINYKYRNQ